MVLLFWCRLTQVVLEKRLLNECSVVVLFSLSSFSFPSPSRTFPIPFSSVRSRTPSNPVRGFGARCELPSGVWVEPQVKSNLVHFSLKIWHLVARILIIFLRINWRNLVQYSSGYNTLTAQCQCHITLRLLASKLLRRVIFFWNHCYILAYFS